MKRKRLLIVLSAIVVLIISILAVIPFLVDVKRIRVLVVSQMESTLQRKVSVQSADLTVFNGLGLQLRQVVVFEDPQFGPIPFFKADSLRVRLKLLPLLSGTVRIGSIQLLNPEISFVKNNTGVWNFQSVGRPPTGKPAEARTMVGKRSVSTTEQAIPELLFRNGSLMVRDETQSSGTKEARYERINLELGGLSPGSPSSFAFQMALPGPRQHQVRAAGQFGPLDSVDPQRTPIDGKIECSAIPISSLLQLLQAETGGTEWQGSLTTVTTIKGSLADNLHLEGKTRFEELGARREGKESPPISGELRYRSDYQSPSSSLEIASAHLILPSSVIDLGGNLKGMNQAGLFDLRLDSDKCSIEDLLKLASILGQGPPRGVQANGQAQFHLIVQGSASARSIVGRASFTGFEARYPGLKDKISISAWNLGFEKNGMTSNEVQIAIGDRTRLKALPSAVFSPRMQVHASLSTENPVLLPDLVVLGSTFGLTLPEGYAVEEGKVNLQVEVQKRLDESAELALSGQASVHETRLRIPLFMVPLRVERAQMKFTGGSAILTDLVASLGESHLQGNLQLVNFNSPSLVFNLNLDQLDLAELDRILNSGSSPAVKSTATLLPQDVWSSQWGGGWTGRVLAAGKEPQPPARDPLSRLVIHDSRASIHRVTSDKLLLTNVTSKVQMKDKALELPDLQFRMYQGTQSGSAIFDFSGNLPRYSFNARLEDVDLNEFLSANTSLKNMIYGRLSLDADLNGKGSGFEEVTNNLKGSGKLNLLKGRIVTFNLSQQIATLGRLAGLSSDPSGTDITECAGDFQVSDGRASTKNLRLRTSSGFLQAIGSFGFDKSVDFQILAEVPSATSRKYAALNPLVDIASATFFRNEQGNLVLPLRMTGTVASPHFVLDSKLVQDLLKKRGLNQTLDSIKSLFKPKPGTRPSVGQDTGQQAAPATPPEKKPPSLDDLLQELKERMKKKKD
jgi:uncharacterized protein involved in outer membrane biogenesis